MTIQMKTTEHYFTVVLFIVLCKVVFPFEIVDEIQTVIIQVKALLITRVCYDSADCFAIFFKIKFG